jgi:hypothetical protein
MNLEELTFKVGGEYITLGLRKYPFRDLSQIKIFQHSNTKDPAKVDIVLERALNRVSFESGHCYSNSHQVLEIGKQFGFHVDFYSGWLIIDGEVIHHAWNVFNGIIIDVSMSLAWVELCRRQPNLTRKEYAKLSIEMEERKPRTSKDAVWGKVPEEVIYVGCPDDKDNAVNIFNHLMEKFPHHPMRKRMLPSGMTPLQLEIYKQKLQ